MKSCKRLRLTDTPGELDIGRAIAAMAGDLQELFAEAKVLGCFSGGEIRDTVRGHTDLRVGP